MANYRLLAKTLADFLFRVASHLIITIHIDDNKEKEEIVN
jgi:hypothetical protein